MHGNGSEFLKQAGEPKRRPSLSVATFALNLHLKAGLRFWYPLLIGQTYSEGYVKRRAIVSQRPSSIAHQHRPMQTRTAVQFRTWSRALFAEAVPIPLDFGGRSTGMAAHPCKYRPKTTEAGRAVTERSTCRDPLSSASSNLKSCSSSPGDARIYSGAMSA